DHPGDVVRKLQQLARRRLVEAVDARDAVAAREHDTGLTHFDVAAVLGDLFFDDVADLCGSTLHLPPRFDYLALAICWRRSASSRRRSRNVGGAPTSSLIVRRSRCLCSRGTGPVSTYARRASSRSVVVAASARATASTLSCSSASRKMARAYRRAAVSALI